MIRNNVPHIFFLTLIIYTLTINSVYADWQPAKEGNKIILIRHSIAPGSGDPSNFNINDCRYFYTIDINNHLYCFYGKSFKKNTY